MHRACPPGACNLEGERNSKQSAHRQVGDSAEKEKFRVQWKSKMGGPVFH